MPIHVAIIRKVRSGCERAFEESLRELFKDSLAREGVLGVHLISPPQGSSTREYGVLRTFINERERDDFYGSERFGQWQRQVAALTEADRRELHGLEAWFPNADSPPRWKMALLTWLALWPISALVAISFGPVFENLPALVSSAIIAAAIVFCLTWIVMPALVQLVHSWLR